MVNGHRLNANRLEPIPPVKESKAMKTWPRWKTFPMVNQNYEVILTLSHNFNFFFFFFYFWLNLSPIQTTIVFLRCKMVPGFKVPLIDWRDHEKSIHNLGSLIFKGHLNKTAWTILSSGGPNWTSWCAIFGSQAPLWAALFFSMCMFAMAQTRKESDFLSRSKAVQNSAT